jgi:hypothetical protein
MKQHTALNWLVPLIAMIAIIITGAGIFSQGGGTPHAFTTVYGDTVELYGRGIYSHDSAFVAPLMRGTDIITLFAAVPLLLVSYLYYRRDSLRGRIFMTAMLTYFLYVGVTYTFSVTFNAMFLFYVALFSASLFATIIAFTTFDVEFLSTQLTSSMPRRGMAIFMIIAGLGTLMLWVSELIGPLLTGTAPANLGPYTTMFTHGFDSAVITPATVITGIYLLRKKSLGYLLVAPLLILCTLIGVVVISQTINQALDGIIFPVGVYIGMVGSWVIMGAFAIGLTVQYFRSFSETAQ